MDYRPGTCSACKASFRIPASFTANRAKCSKCGGVVEIGPVTSDAAGAPAAPGASGAPGASKGAPPVPAKAVSAPVAGAAARLAAKPESAPPPPAKPAPAKPAAAPIQPLASPAKPAAPRPAAAASAPVSPSKVAAKPARATAAVDEDEDAGSRAGRRAKFEKKRGNPLLLVGAGLGFLVIGGGVYWAYGAQQKKNAAEKVRLDAQKAEQKKLQDEEAERRLQAGLEDERKAEEARAAQLKIQEEQRLADEARKKEAAAAKIMSAPAAKPGEGYDLSLIPDFGPTEGTSPERWTELQELAATWVDPLAGARSTRARTKLEEAPKEAFPAILNVFKKLNLEDEDGYRSADATQKMLERICHGHNVGWKYRQEEGWLNYDQKAIKAWCDLWARASVDEAFWKQLTKETGATPADGEGGKPPAKKPDDY